ncbi:hypothetical protein BO85DRAFT_271079 [Aspergillus piperis CBS 112811]|uniref:Uncharacterized protein n=1 Tax=Aspergillus piperis CBS 112811 TaxID=1448313 RepID=A0A8G1VN05_9EURO|nr:hypothetical protein BO85DRAFT_271079 [Aspergillus piperis CBS 112811]RAH58280.1 hypothetical protein BO85DRAFT_271079 [Aspergillus piperis CBS 112811]
MVTLKLPNYQHVLFTKSMFQPHPCILMQHQRDALFFLINTIVIFIFSHSKLLQGI